MGRKIFKMNRKLEMTRNFLVGVAAIILSPFIFLFLVVVFLGESIVKEWKNKYAETKE